jgi:hypothetical protein
MTIEEIVHDARIESLGEQGVRRALDGLARTLSDRKYRLLMTGLFRSLGEFASHPKLRAACEHIEHFADAGRSPRRLQQARGAVLQVRQEVTGRKWGTDPASAILQLCLAVYEAACHVRASFWSLVDAVKLHHQCDERAAAFRTVPIFRDIIGTHFQNLPFLPVWRTSTVVALAQQMYDSRDFAAMPILADALQDAGCDSDSVLSHCRGDGPHVRGCWVIDLILGKG